MKKKNGPTCLFQDTLRVMENRRKMRMEGKWVEARKLNREVQKRIRKDKENYLQKNAGCWKIIIKK
jgi:hypothetical protein